MEYIPSAKPITKYTQERNLSTRERLELFTKVCDAVHHGHQKGIIHRDLKPSNILVDSHGQPRIIDFGVARSTDSDMAVTTLQTDIGQLVGTLQYMSPEQCDADPHDIDTRSDVYALGVVFYELLCGKVPYDVTRVAMHEATRVIREQQPTKLSTLDKTLRGDVETIALKALEKDRDRRYQSAIELGQDIWRYLAGEAITARPPSVGYQLHIFARRNKGLFSAIAVAFVVMLVASGVSTALYFRAETARKQVEHARTAEAEQRRLAETNEASARAEAGKANAIKDFLINDLLASADPEIGQARAITVEEVLNNASERIGTALPDHPGVEASIRATIGKTYMSLGLYDAAEVQLRAADAIYETEFDGENADALRSRTDLAELLRRQGNYAQSEALVRKTLEIQRRVLENEHSDTLKSMNNLGIVVGEQGRNPEAEKLHRQTLEIRRRVLGSEHFDTLKSMNNLSIVLHRQGEYVEVERIRRHILGISRHVLGEEHPQTLNFMNNLGNVLRAQGEYVEAETFHRRTLEIRRRRLGDEHPSTLLSMHNLGLVLWKQGQIAEAATIYRKTFALRRRVLTNEHPATLKTLNNLVRVLRDQGRVEETRPYVIEQITQRKNATERLEADANAFNAYAWLLLTCEPADLRNPDSALPMAKKAVEVSNRQVLNYLDTLALAYQMTGDIAQAIETQRETVALLPPGESYRRMQVEQRLVSFYWDKGDFATAQQICRDILARRRRANLSESHPFIDNALDMLGKTLIDMERFGEAEAILGECLEIRQKALPEGHWLIANTMSLLGASLAGQEKFKEAESLLLEGYSKMKDSPRAVDIRKREALERIVDFYEAWGKPDKAADYRADAFPPR